MYYKKKHHLMIGKYSKNEIYNFYRENGYFVFRNVIDKKLITKSLNEIDYVLKSQWQLFFKTKYPGKDLAIKKLFYRNKNYRRFLYTILNQQMTCPLNYLNLSVVKKICNYVKIKTPVYQEAANRFHIPRENIFVTNPHQDIGIMKTNNSISFWLPLIKSDDKNGSIKIWKKSHNENVIIPNEIDYRGHSRIPKRILKKYEEIWLTYNPGDLIIFHTKTVHTSMPNKSKNCRWAVIFRFEDLSDNLFFDQKISPLSVGYTMIKDKNSYTGFKGNNSKK